MAKELISAKTLKKWTLKKYQDKSNQNNMNYLRFTSYAYIIAGILFAVEAFLKLQEGDNNKAILMGLFALGSVFLFFFRRNFARKFEERNKKP